VGGQLASFLFLIFLCIILLKKIFTLIYIKKKIDLILISNHYKMLKKHQFFKINILSKQKQTQTRYQAGTKLQKWTFFTLLCAPDGLSLGITAEKSSSNLPLSNSYHGGGKSTVYTLGGIIFLKHMCLLTTVQNARNQLNQSFFFHQSLSWLNLFILLL
jgi:hypothetical protein